MNCTGLRCSGSWGLALLAVFVPLSCGESATTEPESPLCEGWNTTNFYKTAIAAEVTACIGSGSNPNATTSDGQTPLHFVAWVGSDPGVVKALVDANADMSARNDIQQSPICLGAQHSDHPPVISALLEGGASVHDWCPLPWFLAEWVPPISPLHISAATNANPDITETLILAGADLNATGGEVNYTPLDLAVERGTQEVADLLRRHGAKHRTTCLPPDYDVGCPPRPGG